MEENFGPSKSPKFESDGSLARSQHEDLEESKDSKAVVKDKST